MKVIFENTKGEIEEYEPEAVAMVLVQEDEKVEITEATEETQEELNIALEVLQSLTSLSQSLWQRITSNFNK